jgi:hypothetical protein
LAPGESFEKSLAKNPGDNLKSNKYLPRSDLKLDEQETMTSVNQSQSIF